MKQVLVEDFHKAFNVLIASKPSLPDKATQELRLKLLTEEVTELKEAFEYGDLIKVADALADLLYVIYGTAVSCGIDMDSIFREVHRSNMTKIAGKDGKAVKPPTYSPPNLAPILSVQTQLAEAVSKSEKLQ